MRASKFKQITRSIFQVKLEKVLCDAEEWPGVLCVHTILGIVRSFLVKLFAKPEVLNWNVLTERILLLIYNLNTSWGRLWDEVGKSQSTLPSFLPVSWSSFQHWPGLPGRSAFWVLVLGIIPLPRISERGEGAGNLAGSGPSPHAILWPWGSPHTDLFRNA